MCNLMHDVETIHYQCLTANSIWISFMKYECFLGKCKLPVSRHHSYFKKDFQMLLAVNEGEMQSPN